MTDEAEIKLLVADDHESVRSVFRAMLGSAGITVVAEAATGCEAVDFADNNTIDVALLDVRMPDGDGLYALDCIKKRHPNLPCVMLSTYDNAVYIERSRMLGASGYLAKGTSRDRLIESIRLVASGHTLWFDGK